MEHQVRSKCVNSNKPLGAEDDSETPSIQNKQTPILLLPLATQEKLWNLLRLTFHSSLSSSWTSGLWSSKKENCSTKQAKLRLFKNIHPLHEHLEYTEPNITYQTFKMVYYFTFATSNINKQTLTYMVEGTFLNTNRFCSV